MRTPLASRLLLAALLAGAGACAKKEQVVIFATSRTQGRAWAAEGGGLSRKTGGFAVFKKLYDAEARPKAAVDLGNWFSAVPEGWLTRGRSTLACLDGVPYAAAAAGMEDLSLSPQEMQKLAESSRTRILASNLYLKSNKKPEFLASVAAAKTGPVKIGFFSVLIASPSKPNRPKYLAAYKLEKETYEAARAVKSLRDDGAQVVVMLLGVNPKEAAGQDFFRDLLSKVPRVDLVITDEPSVKKPFRAGRAWVAPAGSGPDEAARLALTVDPAAGRMTGLDWDRIKLYADKYGEDKAELDIIAGFRKSAADHFARRVGFLQDDLPLADKAGTPAADFASDCLRRWAKSNAAIVGLSELAAPLSSGPVTVGSLYASFPADSSVVFIKIRGDDLERALGGLQPSEISVSGLKLTLKDGAVDRVATEAGPLTAAKVYRVAVPDSLAGGPENAILSSAMEFANSRRSVRDVMGWCFSRQKAWARPEGGRIAKGDK